MKKYKEYLKITLLALLSEILGFVVLSSRPQWITSIFPFRKMTFVIAGIWFCGMALLLLKKGRVKAALSRAFKICNCILSALTLFVLCAFLLVLNEPYKSSFSLTTPLFSDKNVMIVVPHQDDDINILGGLIEQYVDAGSELSVVFTTNGDRYGIGETRVREAVAVLTTLGVAKENIYYLGFGDQWVPQAFDGIELEHIYSSPDPDLVWTSLLGATETYGTEVIGCYKTLSYTRNNYLYAIESIVEEKQPDTIFVVDYDSHIDHKAATLFFDEALCNILTRNPDYRPTVYKGFCYGTAWAAANDYWTSPNLLSTKLPDAEIWEKASYGYAWADRLRFPMSYTNLNRVLSQNSVFISMSQYASQKANLQAPRILNGDKVFWLRRTDNLLYDARILIDGEETSRLNDFKLKDFTLLLVGDSENLAVEPLSGQTVSVTAQEAITLNTVYLYDNPDPDANILEGYIRFSDGMELNFGPLNPDGSHTMLTFAEKNISSMEIVVTKSEGEAAGLCEIEAFYDIPATQKEDTFLMAVDYDDNFVYDYLLADTTTAFRIGSFPAEKQLGAEDVTMSFTSDGDATCRWEDGLLIVDCPKGDTCTITISDGANSTTFTVSYPGDLTSGYLTVVRQLDEYAQNMRILAGVVRDYVQYYIDIYL